MRLSVPTVTRLRRTLAFCEIALARKEARAARLDGDSGGDASMDAILYAKEVVGPLKRLVEVAESAARETAAAERADLLLCISAAVLRIRTALEARAKSEESVAYGGVHDLIASAIRATASDLAPLSGLLETLAGDAVPGRSVLEPEEDLA